MDRLRWRQAKQRDHLDRPRLPAPPEPKASGRDGQELLDITSRIEQSLLAQGAKANGDPTATLAALAEDAAYLRSLTRYETLRLAGPENLAPLMGTLEGFEFLEHFLEGQAWMMMWLTCGPHSKDPAAELGHLAKLLSHDPTFVADPVFKRLATAIAVVGGGSVPLYDYFKISQ